jgi:prevent-host-death family protein
MTSVGVKELKAGLSRFIARAREGEEIVITDHGKDVALIIPLSRERQTVTSLIKKGKAQWSGGKPTGLVGVRIKGQALSKTVVEDRR